jgi:ParB-like chromosome segregation protein Spo0J
VTNPHNPHNPHSPVEGIPTFTPERRPIDALKPFERNARTHSEEQIAQLAGSLEGFGWTIPVLIVGDGEIIAGHGRVLAARKLGLTSIPVLVATGWTEAQVRAYRIADNKLALNADWDFDALRVEIEALSGMAFDTGLTGFSADELAALVNPPEPKPLAAPKVDYVIVFDDAAQQDQWFSLVRHLKENYPDFTIGAALTAFIADEAA